MVSVPDPKSTNVLQIRNWRACGTLTRQTALQLPLSLTIMHRLDVKNNIIFISFAGLPLQHSPQTLDLQEDSEVQYK